MYKYVFLDETLEVNYNETAMKAAIDHCEAEMELGNISAKIELAGIYAVRFNKYTNYISAERLLTEVMADQGAAPEQKDQAKFQLAILYARSERERQAFPLLLNYSRCGKNPVFRGAAYFELSKMYLTGTGVRSDEQEALECCTRAGEYGYPEELVTEQIAAIEKFIREKDAAARAAALQNDSRSGLAGFLDKMKKCLRICAA